MSKSKTRNGLSGAMIENPVAIIVVAVLAILLGAVFVFGQNSNQPILREEAVFYSGHFDHYDDSWENYRQIWFADGSVYDVYAHTETAGFQEKMKSLPKGTKLYLLVNPNNEYVAEIKTDTEELLNFEVSQQEIYDYGWGYVWLGIGTWGISLFLIVYSIVLIGHKRKETERHTKRKDRPSVLRYADTDAKSRTLLEANVQGYRICYRRVKSTNELVVNGRVYDEMTAVIEFAHKLCATVDGHKIEAGYDRESFSYILFDGQTVARKRRWF